MDLDDLDEHSKVPSRTPRFAPGRASKLNVKPKAEPQGLPPKQEAQESAPKPELQQLDAPVSKKKENEVEQEVPQPPVIASSGPNDALKMYSEAKEGAVVEPERDGPMDEDRPEQEEEEEDMVVRRIDVFFTPCIDDNTKIYVLQYPLRPCWRPYELDERCQEVRVKPATADVEIDLSIDVDSKNYDSELGDKLKMTKQTLSSSWETPRATAIAVGVLIGDKLHLNPIRAVVQLRPSMEHLKSGGKRKNNIATNGEGVVKLEESNELKPVSSSKKQKESVTEQKPDDEQCWIPLKYHGAQTDFSSRYLQRMMVQEESPIQFTMSQNDYINSLCPGGSNRTIKPQGPSRRSLLSMPLEERIKKLLCEGFHRFSTFTHYSPGDPIEDVLRVLQQLALLVQGLWTPKTRMLNLNPAHAFARDYLLVLFSKNITISYSQVEHAGRHKDQLKEILSTMAVERPSLNDWKLKEHPDVAFMKRYPDIVKKQEKVLKAMEEIVMAGIRGAKSGSGNNRNIRARPGIASKPERSMDSGSGATKSLTGGQVKRTMSDETRKALPKALKKVFQNHKVCSFQLICQGLRDLAVSKSSIPKADSSMELVAAYGADAPPEELQEVISQVATNIHGFYVLKSSPEHPEYDPLRKVVIDLLCVKGPDARLKKADIFTAAQIALNRDVTNNEYNKVVTDLCESKGSAWVLKRGDGNKI